MKWRQEKPDTTGSDERRLAEEVRGMAADEGGQDSLPASYWANLRVRTNARIDDVASARAISISWAARVAIPGVVAIIVFLVGLHYYAPEMPAPEKTVSSVILSLSPAGLDSLLSNPNPAGEYFPVDDINSDLVSVPRSTLSEYFVEHGRESELIDSLNEREADEVLAVLNNGK